MAAKFRPLSSLVTRVACILCREEFTKVGSLELHRCPVLVDAQLGRARIR